MVKGRGMKGLSFMSLRCLSLVAVRHLIAMLLSATWHLGIGGEVAVHCGVHGGCCRCLFVFHIADSDVAPG